MLSIYRLTVMIQALITGMILVGFKHSASSIPSLAFAGVAIGVGPIPAFMSLSFSRNPAIPKYLVR